MGISILFFKSNKKTYLFDQINFFGPYLLVINLSKTFSLWIKQFALLLLDHPLIWQVCTCQINGWSSRNVMTTGICFDHSKRKTVLVFFASILVDNQRGYHLFSLARFWFLLDLDLASSQKPNTQILLWFSLSRGCNLCTAHAPICALFFCCWHEIWVWILKNFFLKAF